MDSRDQSQSMNLATEPYLLTVVGVVRVQMAVQLYGLGPDIQGDIPARSAHWKWNIDLTEISHVDTLVSSIIIYDI